MTELNPDFENLRVDHFYFGEKDVAMDVLRPDLIHPVVSGNKWFKLKKYLEEARSQGKNNVLTFGGAYSNHIVATAFAAKASGLKSIGLIRGEEPAVLSPTLQEASSLGMKLYFLSRTAYRSKNIPTELSAEFDLKDCYLVDEGGYGILGMEGVREMLKSIDTNYYSDFVCAIGTGTTMAGLVRSGNNQRVTGISVLKKNFSLEDAVNALLPDSYRNSFVINHDYHFGGYARYNEELIAFMNETYRQKALPTDFVYTGKMFYAVDDLVKKDYFSAGSRILVIHSGGLQGNRSLPKGKLIF
jgi:1-aminocyclopropane-1-carboxylate deaminase